jgi:hypothetical protein
MGDEFHVHVKPMSKWDHRVKLAADVLMFVYVAMSAYHLARGIFPGFDVEQKILMARLRQHFPERLCKTPSHSDLEAVVSETTAYLREQGN